LAESTFLACHCTTIAYNTIVSVVNIFRFDIRTMNGFTAFIQEPSNLDGWHTWESFSYLVLEAGTWQWPEGVVTSS